MPARAHQVMHSCALLAASDVGTQLCVVCWVREDRGKEGKAALPPEEAIADGGQGNSHMYQLMIFIASGVAITPGHVPATTHVLARACAHIRVQPRAHTCVHVHCTPACTHMEEPATPLQVFDLTKTQEVTKQTESKQKEAEARAHEAQLLKVSDGCVQLSIVCVPHMCARLYMWCAYKEARHSCRLPRCVEDEIVS